MIVEFDFKYKFSWLQIAPFFSLFYHMQRRPVFYRTSRVLPFQFCKNAHFRVFKHSLQLYHRGVSNSLQ